MKSYIPRKGDFITLTFDPQSGHEQKGRRPALVVSNTLFNKATGLAIVCPVTSKERGFPFHIPVGGNQDVSGFVMVEQVKSIDFRTREARYIGQAGKNLINEVLAILDACLY